MMFIGNLNYVAIAVVGGLRVASGAMQLGDVQAFIQYSRQFTQTADPARVRWPTSCSPASRRPSACSSCSTSPSSRPIAAPRELPAEPRGEGRVEFETSLPLQAPTQPLIEDLSLVAEPGQTVAIVGPTGAGKTTLVNLIMRFYELDGGGSPVDGVDIARAAPRRLRGSIGMVLQDTWLFGGTIRDNIAYGNPDRDRGEILRRRPGDLRRPLRARAARRLRHRDRRGGLNLSAGEKQLITIARAFLADPAILILDEATSLGRHAHRGAGPARDGRAARATARAS